MVGGVLKGRKNEANRRGGRGEQTDQTLIKTSFTADLKMKITHLQREQQRVDAAATDSLQQD